MKFWNFLVTKGSVAVSVLVSLATVTLMFVSIMPDAISRSVMGVMGVAAVLFSVRALALRKITLWKTFAALIIFCEVSTGVAYMEKQSVSESLGPVVDTALSGLEHDKATAEATVAELLDQQRAATQKAFLDTLAWQIKDANADLERARKAIADHHAPGSGAFGLDPSELLLAIPNALISLDLGRIVAVLLLGLISWLFQWTMLAAMVQTIKQAKRADNGAAPKKRRRRRAVTHEPKPEPTAAPVEENKEDWPWL